MEDEVWNDLQRLTLGRDDPDLHIPYRSYAHVLPRNRLSLLARPLNPSEQNLLSVALTMPQVWGLPNRVHGRVLDDRYIQFRFLSEAELNLVLSREPWLYNNWFIALQRWDDVMDIEFLTTIPLWVRIRGIPIVYLSMDTVRDAAGALGHVEALDFDEDRTTNVSSIRVQVRIGIMDRLRFFRWLHFASEETAMIGFEYERLHRICANCCRIMHSTSRCPFLPVLHNPVPIPHHYPQPMDEEVSEDSISDPYSQPPLPSSTELADPVHDSGSQLLRERPQSHFGVAFPCFTRTAKLESVRSNSGHRNNLEIGECSRPKPPKKRSRVTTPHALP